MGYTTNSGLTMDTKKYTKMYLEQRYYKIASQVISKVEFNIEDSEVVGNEPLVISQIEHYYNLFDRQLKFILSEDTKKWRNDILIGLGCEQSSMRRFVKCLEEYEVFIREATWPKCNEILCYAYNLQNIITNNLIKLSQYEEMFIFIVMNIILRKDLSLKHFKVLKKECHYRVSVIRGFVERFYDDIIELAKYRDPGGDSFRAHLGCCFYQKGRLQKEAEAIKKAHISRIDPNKGILLVNELLNALEPRPVVRVMNVSSGCSERTPLLHNKAFHIDPGL